MHALLNLYRRLDLIQQKLSFRLAVTVLVFAVCGGGFGSLLVKSYSLNGQRVAIAQALQGQNFNDGDMHAVSLRQTGTVTINGRTYGDPDLIDRYAQTFDADGEIQTPFGLARLFVADQEPQWAPRFLLEQPGTTWMLAIVATAWLLLIVWMQVLLPFVLTVVSTGLPVAICWVLGAEQAMLAFAGMGSLTFTFVLLTRGVLIAFARPNQILAIAHTVVKEATRSRVSLVFVILLLLLLPLLPIWLDPDTPLRFRVQTFISRSLTLTYVLAACMTLFLSCATIAFEIRDRQIWHLMTKPVTRLNYLLGKWLGVMSVNLIVLTVAGVSIFTYVQYLRELPVAAGQPGIEDRIAVDHEILTARTGTRPIYAELSPAELRGRVEQRIQREPDLANLEEVPRSIKNRLANEIQLNYVTSQRSIPPILPQVPGANQRTYVFEGLGQARGLQAAMTLRYRFHILRDDEHERYSAAFMFNGRQETAMVVQYTPTVAHVLTIPIVWEDGTSLIKPDGTLELTVANLHEPTPDQQGRGALNFEEDDFELLYKVTTFEANFVRAMLMTWTKLAFLTMLGLTCATLLNFPVACLMAFTIFFAGTLGPFLALSLEDYYPPQASEVDFTNVGMVIQWAFQSSIRGIAQAVVFLLQRFGEFRPAQDLVEGRVILWRSVGSGVLWLGFIWSGFSLAIGYLVLRNRQLAIYSGHG